MNQNPRDTLVRIVKEYGQSVGRNSMQCEGLLRDLCGTYRMEINVLVSAIKDGAVDELLNFRSNEPIRFTLDNITKRFRDHTALSEVAAKWAVESWALALELITNKQCSNYIDSPKQGSEKTDAKKRDKRDQNQKDLSTVTWDAESPLNRGNRRPGVSLKGKTHKGGVPKQDCDVFIYGHQIRGQRCLKCNCERGDILKFQLPCVQIKNGR